jgi:hypothetical protein
VDFVVANTAGRPDRGKGKKTSEVDAPQHPGSLSPVLAQSCCVGLPGRLGRCERAKRAARLVVAGWKRRSGLEHDVPDVNRFIGRLLASRTRACCVVPAPNSSQQPGSRRTSRQRKLSRDDPCLSTLGHAILRSCKKRKRTAYRCLTGWSANSVCMLCRQRAAS